MTWETHPVAPDRFEDFADVINRTRRPNHCWCLSHRPPAAQIERLGSGSRAGSSGTFDLADSTSLDSGIVIPTYRASAR